MKRRDFALGLASLSFLPAVCHAQLLSPRAAWTVVPTIAIVSTKNDARLPLVHEAVDFWNRSFAEFGSAFRLGEVTQTTGAFPVDELKALSARQLFRQDHWRAGRRSSCTRCPITLWWPCRRGNSFRSPDA